MTAFASSPTGVVASTAARLRFLHARRDPRKQRRLVHLEFDDGIEIQVLGAQHFGQGLRLTHRARESIQDKAHFGVRRRDTIGDDTNHHLVRH